MATSINVNREYARRIHRTTGAYLALVAWTQDLESVVIDRMDLMKLWGISQRVEDERLDWLKADLKRYFCHFAVMQSTRPRKFGSVYLSRAGFPSEAFQHKMTDEARVELINNSGTRAALVALPTEMEMLSRMMFAVHGFADFES